MTKTITATMSLTMCAGLALAQPTVDGVYDPMTEGSLYGDQVWVNQTPTGFGDNSAGLFNGGDFGNPADVTTGTEICIPLADLGITGTETIRLAGWINSGDRSFMSNQIIGALPLDTGNIGNSPDFTMAPFDTTDQFITIDLSSADSSAPTIDGSLDVKVYSNYFIQGNYTQFGDEQDGTIDGVGMGGGGSEIDGVYAAVNGGNLYLMITGNLENNGNGLDLFFDVATGGDNVLGSGSGDAANVIDGQSGLVFDSAFDADFVVSVAAIDDDEDGMTPNVPALYAGAIDSAIDLTATSAGYGTTGTGAGYSVHVDNSNVEGVIGSPSQATPVSPDQFWGYGSELNNMRFYIDEMENDLYIFVAGNFEANGNKVQFFLDTIDGEGQNVLRTDNVDISFGNLNNQGGVTFDSGFAPDYWFNANLFVDGGSGNLNNFADAAQLRTNGALIEPTFLVVLDYSAFSGGELTDAVGTPTMVQEFPINFDGPNIDVQDGFMSLIETNYAPVASFNDPMNPLPEQILIAINNSNVAGVTGDDASDAANVNTGIEVCIDLDEIVWDGESDIKVAAWITNGGLDFYSNQILGELDPGAANLGPRDGDDDGNADFDFTTVAGNQFINLTGDTPVVCEADLDMSGSLDFGDVSAFLTAFGTGDLSVDFDNSGSLDFGDVSAFLALFAAGCP